MLGGQIDSFAHFLVQQFEVLEVGFFFVVNRIAALEFPPIGHLLQGGQEAVELLPMVAAFMAQGIEVRDHGRGQVAQIVAHLSKAILCLNRQPLGLPGRDAARQIGGYNAVLAQQAGGHGATIAALAVHHHLARNLVQAAF